MASNVYHFKPWNIGRWLIWSLFALVLAVAPLAWTSSLGQTMLSQIVQMVAQAQRSKAPMQRMADQVAGYFVVGVVGIALLTFFAWGLFGPEPSWVYGLINAVAVLIIACPCALGLATPMSIMVATGRGATSGVLFRDAAAIENLRKIDTLIAAGASGTGATRPPFRDRPYSKPFRPYGNSAGGPSGGGYRGNNFRPDAARGGHREGGHSAGGFKKKPFYGKREAR
jgi:hypothetical protein